MITFNNINVTDDGYGVMPVALSLAACLFEDFQNGEEKVNLKID